MPKDRGDTPRRLDPDDVALIEELQSLQGEEMPVDQDAFLEPDEIETRRMPTQTEVDDGMTMPDLETSEGAAASLDGLALDDLREGETDDPKAATEEGLTYVPPLAAEHGTELLPDELDLTARIRDALQADAATTGYADRIAIGTRGSTAVVRGVVDDVDDSDMIMAVIERVDGIENVIDETELADG